jgi:xylitol oxidase
VGDASEPARADLFGAVPATVDRHPILGLDAVNCTPQLGVPGLWSDRLPHFRMGFTPSSGQELQSEYLVPRRHASAAMQAVRALSGAVRPVLQVSEIRTVAADQLWMSPQYGRETVAIHFTWEPQHGAVERVLSDLERALAPFEARPHWGKVFLGDAATIAPLYERVPDFIGMVDRLDPRGAFANAWLKTRVLGRR